MKIKFNRSEFMTKAVNISKAVIDKKPVLPIMGSFMIFIDKNKMYITGTNNATQLTSFIECSSESNTSFCVHAESFINSIRYIDENVTIDVKEKNLIVFNNKSKYKIPIETADNFPRMKLENEATKIRVPSHVFKYAVGIAAWCINDDEDRIPLSGIHISSEDSKITVSGTNGVVVYKGVITTNEDFFEWNDTLITKKSGDIASSLMSGMGDITITSDGRKTKLSDGEYFIICANIDAKYPAVEKLFKHMNDNPVCKTTVNKTNFEMCLKRLSMFVPKEVPVFDITVTGKEVVMNVNNHAWDSSGEEILTLRNSVPETKISLNIKLLLPAITAIQEAEVDLYFIGQKIPAYVCPQKSNNLESFFAVAPFYN